MTKTVKIKPIDPDHSIYKGSGTTYKLIFGQLVDKYGIEEAQKYDPEKNCFTYKKWRSLGFQVQKGEKALKSYTYNSIDQINPKNGNMEKKNRRFNCNLFYYLQVKPIKPGESEVTNMK